MLRQGGTSLALRGLAATAAFLINVLVARFFGAEGAGVYFLAISITGIAVTAARLGLDAASLRFCAGHIAAGEWGAARDVMRRSMWIVAAAAATICALLTTTSEMLAQYVFHQAPLAGILRIMALTVPPTAIAFVLAEGVKASGGIAASQFVQVVLVPLVVLSILWIWSASVTLQWAAWGYLWGSITALAVGTALWFSIARRGGGKARGESVEILLSTGGPILVANLLGVAILYVDTVVLAVFQPVEEVARYGAAARLASLLGTVMVAFSAVASPRFAILYAQSNRAGLQREAAKAARFAVLVSAPLALAMLAAPQWMLGLFGEEFKEAAPLLIILTLGQVVNVATGFVAQILVMTGNGDPLRKVFALAAGFNLVSLVALSATWGSVGAAVASAATLIFINVLAGRVVARRLGITAHALSGRGGM